MQALRSDNPSHVLRQSQFSVFLVSPISSSHDNFMEMHTRNGGCESGSLGLPAWVLTRSLLSKSISTLAAFAGGGKMAAFPTTETSCPPELDLRVMNALHRAICVSILLPVGIAAAQQAPVKAPDQIAQESAHAFVTAYDAGDAAAIAALWTTDCQYTIGSSTVTGREAIEKLYADFLKAHPGSKMEVRINSVQQVAANVLLEEGVAAVTGSPNGPPSSSAYSAVHVYQDGKWLMANVRESQTPAQLPSHELAELTWLVGEWHAKGEAAHVDVRYEWIADKHYLRGETTVKTKDAVVPGGTQITGRDPVIGQLVTWFFQADGGRGFGVWSQRDKRWVIATEGVTGDGVPTAAVNVLYQADGKTMSWRSLNRVFGGQVLPNTEEVVLERVKVTTPDVNE